MAKMRRTDPGWDWAPDPDRITLPGFVTFIDDADEQWVPFDDDLYLPSQFNIEVSDMRVPGVDLARLEITVQEGRPVCTRIELVASEGNAIRAAALRSFPLAKIVNAAALRCAGEKVAIAPDDYDDELGPPTEIVHDLWASKPEVRARASEALRRRRPITKEFLAEVAEVYRNDDTGTPTKAVQLWFNTSHPNAARWVGRARAAGLLDPTSKGKASGSPLAKPKASTKEKDK